MPKKRRCCRRRESQMLEIVKLLGVEAHRAGNPGAFEAADLSAYRVDIRHGQSTISPDAQRRQTTRSFKDTGLQTSSLSCLFPSLRPHAPAFPVSVSPGTSVTKPHSAWLNASAPQVIGSIASALRRWSSGSGIARIQHDVIKRRIHPHRHRFLRVCCPTAGDAAFRRRRALRMQDSRCSAPSRRLGAAAGSQTPCRLRAGLFRSEADSLNSK